MSRRPPSRAQPAPRARQRGALLLILALLMVLGSTWMGLRILSSAARPSASSAAPGLVEARDALLGVSMAMAVGGVTSAGRLPPPDFLDPAEVPANYDGNSNLACALSNWTAGAALPATGGTVPANIRCFGRLPWITLGLGGFGTAAPADPTGIVPWYAMSANLLSGCIPRLNPGVLNTSYTPFPPGTCKTVAQPFPWLTVRDYKGNLLTTRAAFVLILPGPAVGGQTRPTATLSGPSAYLDSVTVAASCQQPCVPGTYDNARFNWPDSVGLSFIQCAPPGVVKASDPSFTQPYNCNDRLLYVTIEELMEVAERRAAAYAAERLQAFFTANLFYPYAAPHDPAAASGFGQCQNGLLRGLVPHVAESNPADASRCTHTAFSVGSWFDSNGWGPFTYYAVAQDCTQPTPAGGPAANCGGATGVRLAAGASGNARALVIGAGAPLVAAPFAASRGAAQNRPSALVADYLDSATNVAGSNPVSATFNRYDAQNTPLARNYNDKTLVVAP